MSGIDVNQVLSSRYRTSQEADNYTDQLRQHLGLDTKAQVARLALGRSLAMGNLPEIAIDSSGRDIPASSLFSAENIGAWIGLLITHTISTASAPIDSIDALRNAIRAHWHRGALALWSDWKASEQNYDRFIETLIRRSEMPDFANKSNDGSTSDHVGPQVTGSVTPVNESALLTKALDELGIGVQVKDALLGPRLTRYRVLLINLGDLTKLNRSVKQLSLAMNLGSQVVSVSNGDEPKTVFVDVPRPKSTWKSIEIDRLREWACGPIKPNSQLALFAGVSVIGDDVVFDLAAAPHLLVGGTTGSGKSVCLHSFILSLLLRSKPGDLQLALVDPKQVEFKPYAKLPNLYGGEIAIEVPEARELLAQLVEEMESRYTLFNQLGVVNIGEARKKGQLLPYIVLFIEELADLVMQDSSIEPVIARLAQKARAAGIHLVLATQRPDSATFSGLIRSNIPGRVALTVQKSTESNIILDEKGAENLLNAGDMLIRMPGEGLQRVHGVFVRGDDIAQLIKPLLS